MKKTTIVEKKLQELLVAQEFSSLSSYQDPDLWQTMTPRERELLGTLFVMQGEHKLKKGDKSALKSFSLAAKLAPKSAKVFYQKGVAFSTQDRNLRCLMQASRAFEKATRLDPTYFDAWFNWAHVLLLAGGIQDNCDTLFLANQKFAAAEPLLEGQDDFVKGNFYWHWGQSWYLLGKISGEAAEISKALEKFKNASAYSLDMAEFWGDYGNALVEQSVLIGKWELFTEAINMYSHAVEIAPDNFEALLNMACAYMRLFEMEMTEQYFLLAYESFQRAEKIYSRSASLWIGWGQLLLVYGKMNRSVEHLKESAGKFAEAYSSERDRAQILYLWGEALMNLGAIDQNYETLRDAQAKIIKSLEIKHDSVDAWYYYGRCLVEIGRYFEDSKYFQLAIEKYRYGMSLNSNFTPFLYGLATCYYEIAEQNNDRKALEQALHYFGKLNDLNASVLPSQFWIDWGIALMAYGQATQQRQYLESGADKFEYAIMIHRGETDHDIVFLDALFNYGSALDILGDFNDDPSYYEKAIQLLSNVCQAQPDNYEARHSLGLALVHLGEFVSDVELIRKGCEHFEMLVNEEPEDDIVWNDWGAALLNLAQLLNDPSCPNVAESLFSQAEHAFLRAISLGNIYAFYNLACCHALIGQHSIAMDFLERARVAKALPPLNEMMQDEWLASLRQTSEFRHFLTRLIQDKR